MSLGITPARGNWEYRQFAQSQLTTLSQGAFNKGDLVVLDHARTLSVFTSTYSVWLGVAMNDSANSTPATVVAIPLPGCTAYFDSLTTDAASSFSLGQAGSIITRYGRTSCLSMQPAGGSTFSFYVTIVGPMDSTTSRIEGAFIQKGATYYSVSSTTINN